MSEVALTNPRTIRAWCMYDWANSVYSLVITSAIFPVYYQAVTTAADGNDKVTFLGFEVVNSVLYSYSISFAFLIIAPLLPLLSGMADYTGHKKFFMKLFCYAGGLACMGLYFFTSNTLHWGIFCLIMSCIGYSGSFVFYDAFLPEIATEDMFDKTSARGYSYGYYGSVIMMIIAMIFILSPATFGFPNAGIATRFSFLLVGLWWIGFAQIPFARLPHNPFHLQPGKQKLLKGYYELVKVWRSFKESRDIKFYIVAYFFYNMGVQTIMYLAATFGSKELKLADEKLIGTVLLIQLVAAVGANLFAKYSKQRGNRHALITMICIWIVVCIGCYFVYNEYQFYAVAFGVGIVMGGIQALSRATYTKLIPKNSINHASYFSFYDVTQNLSIVFGTFSYGLIEHITGSMRNSTLALASYFMIGLLFLVQVRSNSIQKTEP